MLWLRLARRRGLLREGILHPQDSLAGGRMGPAAWRPRLTAGWPSSRMSQLFSDCQALAAMAVRR